MFHSVFVYTGLIVAGLALSLAFLSQRYWFARAWRFSGRIDNATWRNAARGVLLALLSGIALAALAAVLRNARGVVSRGSWWTAFFGLWLSSSIFSYLFIKIIAGAEWIWRRFRAPASAKARPSEPAMASPVPAAGAPPVEAIDHSRRYFFQAAGVIAGVIPFASAAYGFIEERFHFRV